MHSSLDTKKQKYAIIVGAGPAGLTAAYELLKQTDIIPLVFEKTGDIGGISKTVNYKGNRIDIGGHRFFSKSNRVMEWWVNIIPIEESPDAEKNIEIHYQGKRRTIFSTPASGSSDKNLVLLIRNRISRIFHQRKFFDYPLSLNFSTLSNLGLVRLLKIGFSYLRAITFPIKNEQTLEDFFINRFGRELYLTFFKDYTEKVWGVSCQKIPADWGRQRIKGLSITKTILHAIKQLTGRNSSSIVQSNTETSLIEKFLYPKYGPGQMWEEVADRLTKMGGQVYLNREVESFELDEHRIVAVNIHNSISGEIKKVEGDYFFSTMPMKQLISGMGDTVPESIKNIADGLEYRDFITVGLLLSKLEASDSDKPPTNSSCNLSDNWIYIQEQDVKVGRVQIFNNWSPYMVKDPDTVWIGLEYFCNEGDSLWEMPDSDLIEFASKEMERLGFIKTDDILDSTVIRMPKAYPGYFGETYRDIDKVRKYTDNFTNLFLIGRNGMHKYNNQDHSMLSAMTAVDNIRSDIISKDNIWNINTEDDYHEQKIDAEQ